MTSNEAIALIKAVEGVIATGSEEDLTELALILDDLAMQTYFRLYPYDPDGPDLNQQSSETSAETFDRIEVVQELDGVDPQLPPASDDDFGLFNDLPGDPFPVIEMRMVDGDEN